MAAHSYPSVATEESPPPQRADFASNTLRQLEQEGFSSYFSFLQLGEGVCERFHFVGRFATKTKTKKLQPPLPSGARISFVVALQCLI